MYLLLVDSGRRIKAWKNGQFIYTPYPNDSEIIKITHFSEFLFAFRHGDGILAINDDGSAFTGKIEDFLKRMGFEEPFQESVN